MSTRRESVVVVGAGISGLGAALALGDGRRDVTLLDRDPPPPASSPDEAFQHWERRGATQLRHSHAFIGLLTNLIRTRYPALMTELIASGARLFPYDEALPPPLQPVYRRHDGDDALAFLFSRRTTLELVMRRHVERLPGITVRAGAAVRGMLCETVEGIRTVTGVDADIDGQREIVRADIIVDASGRNTTFPDWLRAQGADIAEEESPCGILYFTRHYRLRDGMDEPPRDGTPGGGDMGYIKFGVFIADNRHFSITLAVPEIEMELRKSIVRADIFDAICREIPACARWLDRAEPASQVFSMGNLKNVWRHFVRNGELQALGFFAIGDAAIRTNPLYGRGCSSGISHAHILRDTLDATADPRARALMFERETFAAIRPFFDSLAKQDRQAIRRAEHERDPDHRPRLKARLTKSFIEDGVIPATRGDLAVSRASARAFHMLGHPEAWLTQPAILARVLRMWATPKRIKHDRGYYPPEFGPKRDEMFARLGLAS